MRPDAQQIALLTDMGWSSRLVPSNEEMEDARLGRGIYEGAAGYPIGGGPGGGMQFTQWVRPDGVCAKPPDLTLDLMHEAEKALSCDEFDRYREYLMNDCLVTGNSPWVATKEQRREAYLKTRGLWISP